MMAGKSFKSLEEELAYYKAHSLSLEKALTETQADLEEFQQSSKELEEELTRELDATEKQYQEQRAKNERLKNDIDDWKLKYQKACQDSNITIRGMERELEQLRKLKESYQVKTRELELDNDDLERTERAAKSSLQDFEQKYNKAIERSAILENELDCKNQLIVQVQRLKDELSDVTLELQVLRNKQQELGPPDNSSPRERRYSRQYSMPSHVGNSNPVKMVQEMVGRVKSLEARLVSCRSLVTPLLAPPPSYSTAMPGSPVSSNPNSRPSSPMRQSPTFSSKSYRRTSLVRQNNAVS